MKRISLILFAALLSAYSASAQTKHTLTKSTVAFKIKNMGFQTGGTLDKVTADINFDKEKPEASSITAVAEVAGINTDNDARDKHLRSADYFDEARYPKIVMKSVSLKHKSGNNYMGVFNVTIKDKTKLVDLPFTYTTAGSNAEFKGSFKIKRTDFNVGESSMVLSNDVTVELDIQTTQ